MHSSGNKVKALTGANVIIVGLAVADAADGESISIQTSGIAMCEAGGAIAESATLETTANGRVDDTAGTGTDIGISLAAASAAGEIIPVLLRLKAST